VSISACLSKSTSSFTCAKNIFCSADLSMFFAKSVVLKKLFTLNQSELICAIAVQGPLKTRTVNTIVHHQITICFNLFVKASVLQISQRTNPINAIINHTTKIRIPKSLVINAKVNSG
jgi:hypothetical protein